MVTLVAAKLFLRFDGDDEDPTITSLIVGAASHLESIGVDMTTIPIPDAVNQAQLMLISYWFSNRGGGGGKEITGMELGVDRLIAPYTEKTL